MLPSWLSRFLHPRQAEAGPASAELRRLRRQLKDIPRFTPGVTTVAGWTLHYADAPSLLSGFDVQIVKKSNDFSAPRPDPLVIDCGANIGLSVLRCKQLYPQARVTAFEPDHMLCDMLRANLSGNGHGDVDVVEAAVWTDAGEHLFHPDGADGGMLIEAAGQNASSGLVKTVRLADYLAGEPVDFLKVDIEGAELPVLRSCCDVLGNVRQMVVEVHYRVDRPEELAEILGLLHEAAFRVSVNSYGPWVDLGDKFQRDPVANADQYLLLCAWREDGAV